MHPLSAKVPRNCWWMEDASHLIKLCHDLFVLTCLFLSSYDSIPTRDAAVEVGSRDLWLQKPSSKELYFASVAKIVVTFRSLAVSQNHASTMKTLNVCFGNTELLRTSRSENMPKRPASMATRRAKGGSREPRCGCFGREGEDGEGVLRSCSTWRKSWKDNCQTSSRTNTPPKFNSSPLKSYLPK